MLGCAIAARPLARDGLGQLTSELGRTRLAEAPVPAWGRSEAERAEEEGGASASSTVVTAAMRP